MSRQIGFADHGGYVPSGFQGFHEKIPRGFVMDITQRTMMMIRAMI